VLTTTCDSATDGISDWLNVDRVHRRFVTTSFFLVDACAYSRSFSGFFFGVATVNIFPSVNKMTSMPLDAYFSAIFPMAQSALHFPSLSSKASFSTTNISQVTVATCFRSDVDRNLPLCPRLAVKEF